MKKIIKKAWAITDWGGGIKYPSVSIYDTKEDARHGLRELKSLPLPGGGKANKIIRVEIREI